VLIPRHNVQHLMLRKDVIAAVVEKQFHIHAVSDVDEAMALLTGRTVGVRGRDGAFRPAASTRSSRPASRCSPRTRGGFSCAHRNDDRTRIRASLRASCTDVHRTRTSLALPWRPGADCPAVRPRTPSATQRKRRDALRETVGIETEALVGLTAEPGSARNGNVTGWSGAGTGPAWTGARLRRTDRATTRWLVMWSRRCR